MMQIEQKFPIWSQSVTLLKRSFSLLESSKNEWKVYGPTSYPFSKRLICTMSEGLMERESSSISHFWESWHNHSFASKILFSHFFHGSITFVVQLHWFLERLALFWAIKNLALSLKMSKFWKQRFSRDHCSKE